MKVVGFIAMSLDGYIAKEDHSLDWLEQFNEGDEDCGFAEFYATVDTLVMGRNTYDVVSAFDEWPYEGKRVIVLTNRKLENIESFSGDVTELLEKLKKEGVKKIWVDGGKSLSHFLDLGLIESLTVTILPILLGGGIPLFSVKKEQQVTLSSHQTYSNGLLQLRYDTQTQQ